MLGTAGGWWSSLRNLAAPGPGDAGEHRYGRVGLAGVLVVAVVAVAFGTGYTTTKALSGDGSAWLRKGDTIVHINGPSGRFDATVSDQPTALAASVSDPLEVVEDPSGQVFVADPATHRVYQVNLASMEPSSLGVPGTGVLAAGDGHFVVDAATGTVTTFDPKTLAVSRPLRIPGGVSSAAIAPSGTAYIGSDGGTVTVVTGGRAVTRPVAAQGHPLDVAVVGNTPVAIDTSTGQLRQLDGNGAARGPVISLPGPTGGTIELAPSLAPGNLWLIRGTQLVRVDLTTAQTAVTSLPAGDLYEPPVSNAGDAYVPDDTANRVLVYDSTMTLVHQVVIPPGRAGQTTIEVVVRGGKVWADDPSSSEAEVISPNGQTETVDKGTGNGVVVPGGTAPRRPPAARAAAPANGRTARRQTVVTVPTPPAPTAVVSAPAAPTSTAPVTIPPLPPASGPPPVTTPTGPPTTAAGSTPVPSAPTTTTTTPAPRLTKVPTNLVGQAVTQACATLKGQGLVCAETDQGQAPQGQQTDVVTAVPEAGRSVKPGTAVQVDYYGAPYTVAVPAPSPGETYDTYCSAIMAKGLTCTPDNIGAYPNGDVLDQVAAATPAPGTPETVGTPVTIQYYGDVSAPSCLGQSTSAPGPMCQPTANPTAAAVACNVVYAQSPAAGTAVAPGSAVAAYFDPNCGAPLYEWAFCGARYHYLAVGQNTPAPGSWPQTTTACGVNNVGDTYQFTLATQNGTNQLGTVYPVGTSKPGTRPVYQFQYTNGQCNASSGKTVAAATCIDYDYSVDPNAELAPGWSAGVAVFEVSSTTTSSPQPSGTVLIQAAELNPWGTPGPRGWYTYDYCTTISSSNCAGTGNTWWAWYIYS